MSKKKSYRIFEDISNVDISESDIWEYDQDVLKQLLIDHSVSLKLRRERKDPSLRANIFWGTHDYEALGEGYGYHDEITPEHIVGENGRIVMPRVLKDAELQTQRSKDKAEVFTPSWVCNTQNNLIDEKWFGRKDVFNSEVINEDGLHTWIPTEEKIEFPDDTKHTWKKYVVDNRMEITCGEAPYLVSRYETTTGAPIPLKFRIGLLDRKLRIVSENCDTTDEWLDMARRAYQHTYGYEWQGDNLLLAREALLYTFIEYYMEKFKEPPLKKSIIGIARIISWNLWQMDGLRYVVPDTCKPVQETDLFGNMTEKPCEGCQKGIAFHHTGIPCYIRDWNLKKPKDWQPQEGDYQKSSPWQRILFTSLFRGNNDDTEDDENE